ncbi:hypothetical protein, partial [Staphylococcus aureus]
KARAGQVLVLPAEGGGAAAALFGLGAGEAADPMALRALPGRLPAGDYHLASVPAGLDAGLCALAWGLGSYAFDRYKQKHAAPR